LNFAPVELATSGKGEIEVMHVRPLRRANE
jgi:hypothetical protein